MPLRLTTNHLDTCGLQTSVYAPSTCGTGSREELLLPSGKGQKRRNPGWAHWVKLCYLPCIGPPKGLGSRTIPKYSSKNQGQKRRGKEPRHSSGERHPPSRPLCGEVHRRIVRQPHLAHVELGRLQTKGPRSRHGYHGAMGNKNCGKPPQFPVIFTIPPSAVQMLPFLPPPLRHLQKEDCCGTNKE